MSKRYAMFTFGWVGVGIGALILNAHIGGTAAHAATPIDDGITNSVAVCAAALDRDMFDNVGGTPVDPTITTRMCNGTLHDSANPRNGILWEDGSWTYDYESGCIAWMPCAYDGPEYAGFAPTVSA